MDGSPIARARRDRQQWEGAIISLLILRTKCSRLGQVLFLLACSCHGGERQVDGTPIVSVWAHAGQSAERAVLEDQLARFDRAQPEIRVKLTFLPERSYAAQVQAAAAAGELPDVLECDGPYLCRYAWQGQVVPLDAFLADSLKSDLLPSIIEQGTYRGRLFGVGTFDSGLGIYARRTLLETAGVRIPASAADAWSAAEFDRALAALAARDDDGAVLDLKLNYPGEWLTYAFSPVLQSAGGDLLRRQAPVQASGTLDGAASVAAMERLQRWMRGGLVDPNLDDAAFTEGRVALSWVGHWEYPRYAEAFDDLVIVPLPDFGQGTKTGQGSWLWTISKHCSDPGAAAALLAFLLEPSEVIKMTEANGAVPARRSAIDQSRLYGDEAPLSLFAQQLQSGVSVPRPRTPAYPIITSAFQQAFADVRDGADVGAALRAAAEVIDEDLRDNQGYAPASGQ